MCILPLPALWLTGSASMDKKEYFIRLPKKPKNKTYGKMSYYEMQIKYDTDKNTNLHQIDTAPALHRGRKTIKHERMDNIWVEDTVYCL